MRVVNMKFKVQIMKFKVIKVGKVGRVSLVVINNFYLDHLKKLKLNSLSCKCMQNQVLINK